MADNTSTQLSPEIEALIEAAMDQRLRERDEYYLQQMQAREEELERRRVLREQEFAADRAAMQATLDSVSHQLEVSQIAQLQAVDYDIPMDPPTTSLPAPLTHNTTNPPQPPTDQRPRKKGRMTSIVKQPLRRSPRTLPTKSTQPTQTKPKSKVSKGKERQADIGTMNAQQSPSAIPEHSRPSAKRVAKKPAAQVHRMLAVEVPDDAKGVLAALKLHIRLLWGLYDPKQPPPIPDPAVLESFAQNFQNHPDHISLTQVAREGPSLIAPSLIRVGDIPVTDRGHVASQLRGIEENMIYYIQTCLSRFGLSVWCPDLRKTPYSLFNSINRIAALDTFKQALISHTYAHLAPNLAYMQDMTLLVKMYDHFVHHYQYARFKKETRIPGSVRASDTTGPAYTNRRRLAQARLDFLIENGYPQRYRELVDAKATSDDELDPSGAKVNGRPVFLIKKRPERSPEVEKFIRLLDEKRYADAKLDSSKKWRERPRVVPTQQQHTDFPALPTNMPIDYFSPGYYNDLQPRLRSRVANIKVALLPDVNLSFRGTADERLNDTDFNAKHGERVLEKYNQVEEDFADEEDWVVDDDDEDMDDYEPDEDGLAEGGIEMSGRQRALGAELSVSSA